MQLIPREVDKLTIATAGLLAQRRLARGLKLNYTEASALISLVILEHIRDGQLSVANLMDLGRQLLGKNQVMQGVNSMLHTVQVEGTFKDGSKLVTVHNPIASENGDLDKALYGSFLPKPNLSLFSSNDEESVEPGEVFPAEGEIILNEGRDSYSLDVVNTGDRPVQVGSHFPFAEVNRKLQFDRATAYGCRLDIPAGTAVRFEPGERKTVQVVAISGKKIVSGGNQIAPGVVSDKGRKAAVDKLNSAGFLNKS